MAIAHGASAESGTFGSTTPTTWTHAAGAGVTPDWVLVFVIQADNATDHITTVTYDGVSLTAVSGGFAADTATEPGTCKAYFKAGGAWASGSVTVSVSRDATVVDFYAVSISGSGTGAEVHLPGIVLLQENQALAEQNVTDGSPGTNSVRYAGTWSGLAGGPGAGANSTALQDAIYSGAISGYAATVRETTAGQGSRPVGFSAATDDVAAVHLAIRQVAPIDLVIANGAHAHTADNVVLVLGGTNLIIDNAFHAHAADNLVLTEVPEAPTGMPTLVVKLDLGGYIGGAILDDSATAQLDSAVLGPTTPTFPLDITPYVREISTHRGAARELERIEAGTGSIALDNRDGRFTPLLASSPYYPFILPMRRIQIIGVVSGVEYPVFTGFVEGWPVTFPGDVDTEVRVTLVDGMKMLAVANVSAGFPQQGSGARIGAILDVINWPTAERDIDVGTATIPAITLANVSALEHIQQVAHAEGGRFFIGKDGKAVFREGVEVNPTLTDRTWADNGTGMSYRDITLDFSDNLILNDVHLTRTGGTEQVAMDLGSQTQYGIRSSLETDIQLVSDSAILDRAEIQVQRYAQPVLRLEGLVDNAMQHGLWRRVLIREISDIVKVVESRTQTSQVSSLEGISHDIGRDGSWTVTLAVAPSSLVFAGILDDPTYGLLDSTAILR
jgi:hypothetical protein